MARKKSCTKGGGETVKMKQREECGGIEITLAFPPPSLTFYSNSKSNMVGRINDSEPLTLTRPNKMPVL